MAKCVIAVLLTSERAYQVCDLWEQLGVSGVTIMESNGYASLQEQLLLDDIPLVPSLRYLEEEREVERYHRVLFTVVPDEFDLDRLVEETDRLAGGFDTPHSGILFVLPILTVRGLLRPTEPG
jgi:hypothetical protein